VSIKIVVVGKTRETSHRSLERLYLERLTRYTKVHRVVVREGRFRGSQKANQILKEEAQGILREIGEGDFCVALDSRGKEMTSLELADFLQRHLLSSGGPLVFVIGGPLGLPDEVRKRASLLLSFSRFTFTHEMIRVLLLEQLYRAWTLLRGEKYHK
jgi:23S rRNA (pseudouridine1915-N3)-methyltransferase